MNTARDDLAQTTAALEGTGQFLTFLLGGEEYAVDILSVVEIKSGDKITRIPKTPEYILGVMNLRGDIVPVVDLRERFMIEIPDSHAHEVVIIVSIKTSKSAQRLVGVVVDDVSDVYSLSEDQIKRSPEFGAAISTEFIRGIATLSSKIIIVLDCDRLFSLDELSKIEELEERLSS